MVHEQQTGAAELLEEVRSVRLQTRSRLQSYWLALLVFGTLLLGSAPFFALLDGAAVGLYWLVAGPLGTIVVSRRSRRRRVETGVMRSPQPYSRLVVGLFVACFALGTAGGITNTDVLAEVGPPVAISCSYLVLAWIERSRLLGGLAVALGALALGLVASGVDHPGAMLAIVYGSSFIVIGLVARARVPAP